MLHSLKLVNFRAFKNFTINLKDGAYLVGPNNAGKTTILTAIRIADILLRVALQRKPSVREQDNGVWVQAYPITLTEFPALLESIHHEFLEEQARLEITWANGSKLIAVWPRPQDEIDPFFYLRLPSKIKSQITIPKIRQYFEQFGVVPILAPIEHTEPILTDTYVKASMPTRLSSRHFRNQMRLLVENDEYDEFETFLEDWAPELTLERPTRRMAEHGTLLDIYYREQYSRVPKELIWAGDGIQIWLQLLFHIFRARDVQTIVLDEPEVYLHADLQRRLVQLLESTDKQIIVATHSPEIITEAPSSRAVLIDKNRPHALKLKDNAILESLSESIGTQFNLRLARALRSKVALFLEGKDMVVLRRLCKTLGLEKLEREIGITIIPMHGYSKKDHVQPFAWLSEKILTKTLALFVILDHDYRPEEVSRNIEKEFAASGIEAHIWRRKELESYIITPSVIARITGCEERRVKELLLQATDKLQNSVFGQILSKYQEYERPTGVDAATTAIKVKEQFDKRWPSLEYRIEVAPAKQVISNLNQLLRQEGKRTVSARSLASEHEQYEIPSEMIDILVKINQRLETRGDSS